MNIEPKKLHVPNAVTNPPTQRFPEVIVSNTRRDASPPRLRSEVSPNAPSRFSSDSVLLIIASNRPQYLEKSLSFVMQYHPKSGFPIVISEDGFNAEVAAIVDKTVAYFSQLSPPVPVMHLHHPNHRVGSPNGYFKLSKHFKWVLTQLFSVPIRLEELQRLSAAPPNRIVILEEDLQIATDFFEFFEAVTPLIDSDNTLLAASAWNDNGQEHLIPYSVSSGVFDPKTGPKVTGNDALVRSDFFFGLGWMLPRRVWEQDNWAQKWPDAYWDDWLREPPQRQGRHTIRPEVCRTFHFGHAGVSNGQFSEHLTKIKLNAHFVPFTTLDLHYLKLAEWDERYLRSVRSAPVMSTTEVEALLRHSEEEALEVQVRYTSLDSSSDGASFVRLANWCGAMDNIKANVPRTAYKGIVTVYKRNKGQHPVKLHLVPASL